MISKNINDLMINMSIEFEKNFQFDEMYYVKL